MHRDDCKSHREHDHKHTYRHQSPVLPVQFPPKSLDAIWPRCCRLDAPSGKTDFPMRRSKSNAAPRAPVKIPVLHAGYRISISSTRSPPAITETNPMATPARLVRLKCPRCSAGHWVVDSDYRGSSLLGFPELSYEERTYDCPRCGQEGTGFRPQLKTPVRLTLRHYQLFDLLARLLRAR